jgi:hypothetical protein
VNASLFSTPQHRHPEEQTGEPIPTRDGGHFHGERVTGEAVEPDELIGG